MRGMTTPSYLRTMNHGAVISRGDELLSDLMRSNCTSSTVLHPDRLS